MNTVGNADANSGVSCVHGKAELRRLLQDSRFHGTERTRSILKYLAERRFDGQDESVKAYAIALDVLGRASDFDPTTDPIVRIEMSRVRSALAQYYEAFGSESGVVITLPKGNYVAVFTYTDMALAEAPQEDISHTGCAAAGSFESEAQPSTVEPAIERQSGRDWSFEACLGLVAVVTALTVTWFGLQPDITEKPTVAVTMSAAETSLAGEASLTRDMLMTALTQFRTLTLASGSLQSGSLSNSMRPPQSNSYTIDLKYYADADDRSVWWQIVDAQTGDLLKSGLERVSSDGKADVAVRDELVTVLSRRFATSRGVISNIEMRLGSKGALGNACVLRAEYSLDDGDTDDATDVAGCLERTVARDPADSDAIAALSRVLVAKSGGQTSAATMERSLDLASGAAAIAPLSDRAQVALMMAQFYSGRTFSAIDTGKRAMALNPNNPDVMAKFGFVLFSSGYWNAGVSLAVDAGRSVDVVPRDATMVLALDAYRRGDWSTASLLSEQINTSDVIVRMLRAASLGELQSDQAGQRLADVRSREPDFERNYSGLMAARRFDASLADSIKTGLVKAGARVDANGAAGAF